MNEKENACNSNIGSETLRKVLREYSINRRKFLAGMITTSIAATFSPLAFLSSTQAQTQEAGIPNLWVDVHCHIFNANDLPVDGAIQTLLEQYTKLNSYSISVLLGALLKKGVPGYVDENKKLDKLLDDKTPPPVFCEDFTISRGDFDVHLGELKEQGVKLIDLLTDEERDSIGEEKGGIPEIKIIDALWFGWYKRGKLWIMNLRRFRYQIACSLLNTFKDDKKKKLFTPAIIDLDHWVPDRAETNIAEQIILYEKIIRLFKGEIHPLVAFNPLKEILYKEIPEYQPLKWVKKAVEERGFVGVKLYPPMGFYPLDNRVLDPDNELSLKIDEVLNELYDWCAEKDVPIMAHCNNTNESQDGFGERANPIYWKEKVLGKEGYENLRLNLAHFGGTDSLMGESDKDWTWTIADMMENYRNVYADTGFHDIILKKKKKRAKYTEALKVLYHKFPDAKERLMYGTDWHVIMLMKNHKEYADRYEKIYKKNFSDVSTNFFGQNALRFLGLDGTPSGNRYRLLKFYKRHNMKKPNWWVGDWWHQ